MQQAEVFLNSGNVEIEKTNLEKDSEIRFDINFLHSSNFKRMVKYLDSICVSPTEYLIGGLLAAMSGAVGKQVFFNITSSIKIYLNLWVILIGRSSTMRKTTSINYCKEELQRIENKSYSFFKSKLDQYELDLAELKTAKEKNQIPKPIREYFLIPSDCTIESLSDILSHSKRGLLTHSEFASFLNQFNKSYNADAKQFFTSLYDTPQWYEVSRVTKGNTILQRPYLSILAASTSDWLQEFSTESDLRSGFFARFIYCIRNVPDKKYIPLLKLRELGMRQSETYFNVREVFDFLVSIDQETPFEISDEAAELHIKYDCEGFKALLCSENETEIPFKARGIINTLKVAGLIALSDKRFLISREDMQDAINLNEKLFEPNISKLLNIELKGNEFSRKEDHIVRLIKNRNGIISRSDLLNSLSGTNAKQLSELISNLKERELIEEVQFSKDSSKRKSLHYKIKD